MIGALIIVIDGRIETHKLYDLGDGKNKEQNYRNIKEIKKEVKEVTGLRNVDFDGIQMDEFIEEKGGVTYEVKLTVFKTEHGTYKELDGLFGEEEEYNIQHR